MKMKPMQLIVLVFALIAAAAQLRAAETLLVIQPSESQPRNSEGDIIPLEDGRLCLIYSRFRGGGSDHDVAELARRISADGGRTWSDDEVLVAPLGGLNVMSVSLLRLQDGSIALFYLRKTSLEDCRPVMQISRDEGVTWTEPTVCITDDVGYYVLNNDRAVQLPSGRLVLPVALHRRLGDLQPDWEGQVMCYLSDDQGNSWRRSKDVRKGTDSAGNRVTVQEPGVVLLQDERLMMYCRTDTGSQYISYSTDEGDTWSELAKSKLASPLSPATIERIPASGRLLCIWNDHSAAHPFPAGKRTPLAMAVSDDDGQTWSPSHLLEGYPYGWYCYTSLTFHQGRALLSYCAGDNEVGGLNRLKVAAVSREELDALSRREDSPETPTAILQPALDYGRSFINTKATWNSPRFWVESRCRISDPTADFAAEYHQCGSCKSEDTFAASNLFHSPNYDFLPIFSEQETVVFRHGTNTIDTSREVRPTEKWWDGIVPKLREVRARVLRKPQEIFAAMDSGLPIVGQTQLTDPSSGRTAVLEYPIKTINWHRDKLLWQVDTGPVLLPDLSQPPSQWSHTIQLAYIAFNHSDWADFVVKHPTAVVRDGEEKAQILHYSRRVNRRARNVLLAIDDE